MTTRRQFLAALGAGSAALAGCTDGGQPETTPTSGNGGSTGENTVAMVDTSFDPVQLAVAVGTTVEWVNEDDLGHDVTAAQFHDAAAAWSFSESVGGGERASYTFDAAGVYEYYCTIHGDAAMCGVVLVGDAALESSLPCEGPPGGGGGY